MGRVMRLSVNCTDGDLVFLSAFGLRVGSGDVALQLFSLDVFFRLVEDAIGL